MTVLIDGECPLCRREAAFLRKLDRQRGRLALIDITDPSFEPEAYGRSMDELMGHIHGQTGDGRLVTGVEVFRRAYAAVGLGWVLAPTAWPGLRRLSDAAYTLFARYRLRLTGRRGDAACTDRCSAP